MIVAHRSQRGFTLMEVLVALVVFAISVIGLVAMESRSVESQKASAEIREAERIAQQAMNDLNSRSFLQMLQEDFEGDVASFPYVDDSATAANRVFDFRRPPADADPTNILAGSITSKYIVIRGVDLVTAGGAAIVNPTLPDDLANITGMEMQVTVMWIDDTNPAFPPPATIGGNPAIAENLTLDLIDPTSGTYEPAVSSVVLRTVRINDVPNML